jgi:LmbE family N-acetylglucosaminyl deacetylase
LVQEYNKLTNILAIGSHPDDIEIGCGGLFLSIFRGDPVFVDPKVTFLILTKGDFYPSFKDVRTEEQEQSARFISKDIRIFQSDYPDIRLNECYNKLIETIESIINDEKIDAMFTHCKNDIHHDHQAVYKASLEAGRRVKSIFCYEEPISLNFNPHWYHDISRFIDQKIMLIRSHKSQLDKISLTPCAIKSLGSYRANQYQLFGKDKFAEAFEVIKMGSRF